VPKGYIDIELERKGGEISLAVRASRKMNLSVKLPGGKNKDLLAHEYFAKESI
jgi:hypothetical protein